MSDMRDTKTQEEVELPWSRLGLDYEVDRINEEGFVIDTGSLADHADYFCQALDLQEIEFKRGRLELKPLTGKRYSLKGKLAGRVMQTCSVSLKPVSSEFLSDVDIEFWPAEAVARYIASQTDAETDPFEDDEPEPIEDGVISVGRYIYEVLSTSVNPYPRDESEEFQWSDPKGGDASEEHPFAALKKLKSETGHSGEGEN